MKIQVKHLVAYLQSFPQEADLVLNKDGWMASGDETTPEEVIEQRGIFYFMEGHDMLIVNN